MDAEEKYNPAEPKSIFERMMRYMRPVMLVVTAAALIYLIHRVGVQKLIETAKGLSPGWVAAALIFWALNVMTAAVRFRSLAAPEVKYIHVLEVVMAGYLLNYVGMIQGAGVGAKVGLMKGRQVAASSSLAGAGGEVILDFLFTGIVAVVFAASVGPQRLGIESLHPIFLIAICAMGLIGLIAIVLLARVSKFGAKLAEAFRAAFSIKRLWVNLISTAGVWVLGGTSFYCVLRAARADVPLLIAISAMCAGFVIGLISLVPGGLGVRDVTWAFICSHLTGAPLSVTTTAAFGYRIMGIISVAIAMGIWMLFKKSEHRG